MIPDSRFEGPEADKGIPFDLEPVLVRSGKDPGRKDGVAVVDTFQYRRRRKPYPSAGERSVPSADLCGQQFC